MHTEGQKNVSFFDFIGGIQLLHGEDTKTVLPVVLIGICVSGALGNLLVLLIFLRDFRHGRGSEIKALLASLASTDLLILLLCAPVRAVTYYKQTWTLGSFVCATADWFQHSCVVAKTLILAVTSKAKHNLVPSAAKGPLFSPTWIHGALAFIWTVSMLFPVPQMLFAALQPSGPDAICVSEIPACASDFMALFYKIYPAATFALPTVFTLAYYTQTLYTAVNHAPGPLQQSKVTLLLLCVSGANALMLLPEWGTFTWVRLGYSKPPVGVVICAQVLLYACSALSPVISMTMYDDVRQGVVALWLMATCRSAKRLAGERRPGTDGVAEEEIRANSTATANNSQDPEKTFPDVEHFWTGRRDTYVEENQDPIPWEREEKML
ncbi:G-protein coupled receptor 151 [Lampris incognitus]|uniref:G-protein coupled receptor 151 n=1 Tax=Lampris incognitus TaxID=2546036 RepID=UPI0024B4F638|nr:G-protein coupled receptor 151 [Lampris incognitus]